MSAAIALFAKAPIAGRVKTRLQPPLTQGQAADLHLAFALDVWESLSRIPDVSLYLYRDEAWPLGNEPAGRENCCLQQGSDLGERMLHCFEELQARGHDRVLIVGSDSPSLRVDYLAQGLERLRDTDAVLGPSADGGYYAVGCRRALARMFAGVHWSTASTKVETERAFEREGLRCEMLPEWYDIDTEKDLRRLAGESNLPRRTKAWFDRHDPFGPRC